MLDITRSSCPVAGRRGPPLEADLIDLASRPLRIQKKKELPPIRPIIGPEPSRRAPPPPQEPKRNQSGCRRPLRYLSILCSGEKAI
jgi:hypothetical protein